MDEHGGTQHGPGGGNGGSWLGVDLGTQSARVVAVGADGAVLARSGVALTSRRDGTWHEQDPEDWWSAVVRAAQVVTREIDAGQLAGVAVCSTSGTVLFTESVADDPARPVTPALMYDDTRAHEHATRVAAEPAAGWARAGARPQASWGLAKALWLLGHRDVPKSARLTHQADLINARLTGTPVPADWSHALKSGVDLTTGDWPRDDLARLGLPPERLPAMTAPGRVLGEVESRAAEVTGIPAGTPVVAGLTDGCAAQVASGALRAGAWNFALGTTLVLKGTTPEPLLDPSGAVYSHRSPDGTWWPGGASSAGAGALSREFGDRDLAALDRAAAEREPAACLTYPLVGSAERFPFVRPDAVPFTVGEPRDEIDRYAAILQGVGFVERLCLEHVHALGAPVEGAVCLTGGGTGSAYWNQLQADILGRPVVVPATADSAFGIAVVAASTAYGSLGSAASALVRTRDNLTPRSGVDERMSEAYARWREELVNRGWL